MYQTIDTVIASGRCDPLGVQLVTKAAFDQVYSQAYMLMGLFILTVLYNLVLMQLYKYKKIDLNTFYKRWQHSGMVQTVLASIFIGLIWWLNV